MYTCDVYLNRKAIPLNENEGIYVRNVQTGQVSNNNQYTCIYRMRCNYMHTLNCIVNYGASTLVITFPETPAVYYYGSQGRYIIHVYTVFVLVCV